MTHEQKILKVMQGMKLNRTEAEEKVFFLNWIQKENSFLEAIYPNFLKDIDPNASFMAMCDALWNDESTGIRIANLNVN